MTIIIGLIDQDGRVYMGADTVRSNGNRYVDRNSKITRMPVERPYRNKMQEISKESTYILVGASGSVRAAQVIGEMSAPDWPKGHNAYRYLVGPFVSAVRDSLAAAGQVGKSPAQIDECELTLLVGIDGGRLFTIWQDFSVTELVEPYTAVGSGTDLALGALFAMRNVNSPPRNILLHALRAAAAYDGGCGAPFDLTDADGDIYRVDE